MSLGVQKGPFKGNALLLSLLLILLLLLPLITLFDPLTPEFIYTYWNLGMFQICNNNSRTVVLQKGPRFVPYID